MLELIGTIIVAVGGLLGVILTNAASNKKVEQQITTSQAVTEVKIENLTEEVRKHNNFAQKIPLMEEQIKNLQEDVKELKYEVKQQNV